MEINTYIYRKVPNVYRLITFNTYLLYNTKKHRVDDI